MSIYFMGELVLQNPITGMFTYEASVIGWNKHGNGLHIQKHHVCPWYLVITPRIGHDKEAGLSEGLLDLIGEGAGSEAASNRMGPSIMGKLENSTLESKRTSTSH